ARMHTHTLRGAAVIAVALVTALAGVHQARAAGAVNINSCQVLSIGNTTYKLTNDLTSCGNCLVVAADKITIDLQGHSITNTGCLGAGAAISDEGGVFDVITVKNGSVGRYGVGVFLSASTRVSVLGITASHNIQVGIWAGDQALVKSSETANNGTYGIVVGNRGQVQQCNSHNNLLRGIFVEGDNSLVTMNTANSNGQHGIQLEGSRGTASYNTANGNGGVGIFTGSTGHLITQNVALNNSNFDYAFNCPSDVTNNTSTNGFPSSYDVINGTGCHFVNNN